MPGKRNAPKPALIDPQKVPFTHVTHKTRDNVAICQSFGQQLPLLPVPRAEISIAVRGNGKAGVFDRPQIRQLVRDSTFTNSTSDLELKA